MLDHARAAIALLNLPAIYEQMRKLRGLLKRSVQWKAISESFRLQSSF